MRVLLAEPNQHTNRLLSHCLSMDDVDVISVCDSAQVLKALDTWSFDLIVIDLCIDGTDGVELVKIIRRCPGNSNARVLVCSNAASSSELSQLIDTGADDFLELPSRLDIVKARLKLATLQAKSSLQLRAETEQTQSNSEHLLPDVFINLPLSGLALSSDERIIHVNRQFTEITGYSERDVAGLLVHELVIGSPQPQVETNSTFLPVSAAKTSVGKRLRCSDGQYVEVELWAKKTVAFDRTYTVVLMDKKIDLAPDSTMISEQQYSQTAGNGSKLSAVCDKTGDLMSVSPALDTLLGHGLQGLAGTNIRQLIHPQDVSKLKSALSVGVSNEVETGVPFRFRHADGSWTTVMLEANHCKNMLNGDCIALNISTPVVPSPTTPAAVSQIQLSTDSLIRLHDRAAFLAQLENVLQDRNEDREPVSVLFIDLDGFRTVNESLGYKVGDELLKMVGDRLRSFLREYDLLARVDGDEFAIHADGIHDHLGAVRIAERIIDDFRLRPFQLRDHEIYIRPSVGIALSSNDIAVAADLLRSAAVAMNQAKKEPNCHYSIFDPTMLTQLNARFGIESDLQRALELDQLRIYYQPEVDLNLGSISGVEALVRWEHPVRGLILPNRFIRTAEEIGLIQPIGNWVLEQACRQTNVWLKTIDLPGEFIISVNFSANQFANENIVVSVERILRKTGLPAKFLRLEITESVLIEEDTTVMSSLNKLKELGVSLAIDDFGTGYSSLSYLRSLPVNVLKIDRSFMRDSEDGSGNLSITHSVNSLAQKVGMDVVVEGIETVNQLIRVKEIGCRRGQGFLFSHPVDPSTMTSLLATGSRPFRDLIGASSMR